MTQDQCLDNGHQAAGSSHSANDKTSDDPNNSNNSIHKSGINTAQEFNVDVNSKRIDQQSADVVIVRNFGLDTDRSSTDNNGLTTSDNSLGLTSSSVDSTENIISNAIDNSLATKMTVITHQSSDENIREIILHPDDLNKIPNDSQENAKANLINEQSYNKPNSKDKNTPQIRRGVRKDSETEKPEDPIERLNKLRASISSALSEVKGVLKQYSTEQSLDEAESESSQSSKPPADGPVRFRFVRKIRRRSVFSEDDVDVTSQNSTAAPDTPSTCNSVGVSSNNEAATETGNGQTIPPPQGQAEKLQSSNVEKGDSTDIKSINNDVNGAAVSVENEENRNKSNLPVAESSQVNATSENNKKHNSSDVANKKMKTVDDSIHLNNIRKPLDAAAKTTKPSKKLVKKDRRASVALGNTTPQLDLKAQRRPSDSGTIVKHPTAVKPKTGERPKLTSQKSIKAINKADTPVMVNTQDTPTQVSEPQQVDTISNGYKNSTADTRSECSTGITVQASNITEGSANTQTVSHLKEATKPDATQNKEENNEPASQTHETEQEKETLITISNSPVDAAGPEHHENTEVVNDEKANIQEDATSETDVNSKPSTSEDNPETEGETTPTTAAPVVEEETKPAVVAAPAKSKKKAKRKVVIRRIKRKLSKDDTFIQVQETPSELEIEEKEIQEQDDNDDGAEEPEEPPKPLKPCIKARQFEIGDIVMYAERYKKTQVKWRKATIVERITSISYKLDIEGEEKPAHISYIKKFNDRKVNFGGKEYLEIDYAQIEEDEEKERNYSIWNLV